MNTFLRDAVVTVLTSTLNELIVISHGKHLRSSTSQKNEATQISELKGSNLPVVTLNEIKLKNDLQKLIDIYLETLAELQVSGTIHTLLATINQQLERNKEEEKLIQEHKSIMSALRTLKSKLTEFNTTAENKLMQAGETLNHLKSEWRIISRVNELENELVKKWEYTRLTQATFVGEKDEEILERSISVLLFKTTAEKCAISGFEDYSKRQCDKYSELIEMWKEKHSKELKELLISISEKERKIKEVNKTYEKRYGIYCKRKKFIIDYLEQKAEQNRLFQLHIRRIESAVRIQAWWRGLMVRRCLGPYRKKTKKGKKSKKAK